MKPISPAVSTQLTKHNETPIPINKKYVWRKKRNPKLKLLQSKNIGTTPPKKFLKAAERASCYYTDILNKFLSYWY
jgi:hypothetical protein